MVGNMPPRKYILKNSHREPVIQPVPDTDHLAGESPTNIPDLIQDLPRHRLIPSCRCVKLLHAMIVHLTPADDNTGMLDIEDDHDEEHECRIKDVKVDLRAQKNSALTAGILGYAEDTSDHDEETGEVEDPKIARPREWRRQRAAGWSGVHPLMPGCRNDDEERKEGHLKEQTGKDNVVGKFGFVLCLRFGEHATACEIPDQYLKPNLPSIWMQLTA